MITEGTIYIQLHTNRHILYGKVGGPRKSVRYNQGYVISESVITVLLYAHMLAKDSYLALRQQAKDKWRWSQKKSCQKPAA